MKIILILFSLNLFFASLTFAETPCKIDGISNSPQVISCRMRGPYFELMEARIFCKNGQYHFGRFGLDGRMFDENLITEATHMETNKGPSVLRFYVDDFGQNLELRHRIGKRWIGEFEWALTRMRCKLSRQGWN